MNSNKQTYVYIMVSKTNTLLGMTIQKMLGVSYNHCSIALDDSLETIYSIGRKELHNIFNAGFVVEGKGCGYFAAHENSNIILVRIAVDYEEKERIYEEILKYQNEQCKYNLLGLIYCYFGIAKERDNRKFCSQFVAEVLESSDVNLFDKPATLIRPHDFLEIPSAEVVYYGSIGNYHAA